MPAWMRAEIWDHAVRAYPNGIPAGARAHALDRLHARRRGSPATITGSGERVESTSEALIAGTTWFPIGPAGIVNWSGSGQTATGRISAIAVNPNNLKDVWLGAASGGLWHNEPDVNGPWHWVPKTDYLDDASLVMASGAIVLDLCDATRCNVVWAGTGENNIRRDTYYGAGIVRGQWNGSTYAFQVLRGDLASCPLPGACPQFLNGTIHNLVLDHAGRVWVALSSGLTANADQASSSPPAPGAGFGIFRSDDGGATWTNVLNTAGVPTDLEFDPQSPANVPNQQTLYAAFQGNGIFKTSDGGDNWVPLNTGIEGRVANADSPELALLRPSSSQPAKLILALDDTPACVAAAPPGGAFSPLAVSCAPEFLVLIDNGTNAWVPLPDPSNTAASTIQSYPSYTHAFVASPSGALFYGGVGFYQYDPGMQAWTNTPGDVHGDHHGIFLDPVSQAPLYDVNDGGFAVREIDPLTGSAFWNTHHQDGLQITQLQSLSTSPFTEHIIGGSQDNGTVLFSGSRGWDSIDVGDSASTVMDHTDTSHFRYIFDIYTNETPRMCTNFSQCPMAWPYITSGLGPNGMCSGDTGLMYVGCDETAFYPPMLEDPSAILNPNPFPHLDLYFGASRLYRGFVQQDGTSFQWASISGDLGGPANLSEVALTTDVITAIGVSPSDPNTLYVGYYDGKMFVTHNARSTPATFSQIPSPANRVITSIAVAPTIPEVVFLSVSGFGGAHVFGTTDGGQSWNAIDNILAPLPDIPVNALGLDGPIVGFTVGGGIQAVGGNIWAATDIGVFEGPVAVGSFFGLVGGVSQWDRVGVGTLPNVPVYAIDVDELHGRVYAGTHGRGVFVITSPFVTAAVGNIENSPQYIVVTGNAFQPGEICDMSIVQQNGNICASSTNHLDALSNPMQTNAQGVLTTTAAPAALERPMAIGCANGLCVGGVPSNQCAAPNNPVSTVVITCGPEQAHGTIAGGAPLQNPPSSALLVQDPRPAGSPDPSPPPVSFDLFATVQASDGSTRSLCSVSVPIAMGEGSATVMPRAASLLSANPACATATVSARLDSPPPSTPESPFPPALSLSAPGVTGNELIAAVRAPAGGATNFCFNLGRLGVPLADELFIPRLTFETGPNGAGGGRIVVTEGSKLGNCEVTVPTTAGETASGIATGLQNALLAPGLNSPLPFCASTQNPRDVAVQGATALFSFVRGLQICVQDPSVGFTVAPVEITQLPNPPSCTGATPVPATLAPPDHQLIGIDITGISDLGASGALTVTGVKQDEPQAGSGQGNADPDAIIQNETTPPVLLRAERSGLGDGRTYYVSFLATNASGGACQGTVKVCVPHDQAHPMCGDHGPQFVSTGP